MTMSNLSSSNLRQSFQAATVTGTTGSPATGSFTDSNGFTWSYYSFTAASGSLTVGTAGYMDLLVVGSGGGGENGPGGWLAGGGAGGVRFGIFWVPAGTYTVTVGAGAAATASGNPSSFGSILGAGGGNRGKANNVAESNYGNSAIGGGGSGGGVSIASAGSGYRGGGAGGLVYGSNSYDGITLNYNNASVTYGTGGWASVPTTANTGNGGWSSTAGQSGIVVAKVRTN